MVPCHRKRFVNAWLSCLNLAFQNGPDIKKNAYMTPIGLFLTKNYGHDSYIRLLVHDGCASSKTDNLISLRPNCSHRQKLKKCNFSRHTLSSA